MTIFGHRCAAFAGLLALLAAFPACSSDDDDADSNEGSGASSGSNASGGSSSGSDASGGSSSIPPGTDPVDPLPAASCDEDGGSSDVSEPVLVATLFDRWHEAWLGSPAVADLDDDGENEIIVPRDEVLLIWHLDGSLVQKFELPGRIWAPPVVADIRPDRPGLEVAVASRGTIAAWDAEGEPLPGFPFTWRDELRSLAAEDIDDDGELELVSVTTGKLEQGGQTDIVIAVNADGTTVQGFPPNTTGSSGCVDAFTCTRRTIKTSRSAT